MHELIERDNVIAYLNAQIEKVQSGRLHDYGFPTNIIVSLTDVKNLVRNLPTIEAVPARHGRWESGGFCSECKLDNYGLKTDYCPNCGVKMDGGAENGN